MKKAKDYKISVLADIYGELLTKRQLDIIRDYYDYDSSLAELSEKYGIARQSAKDSINSAIKSLNAYEEKLNIMKKSKDIFDFCEKLLSKDLIEEDKELVKKIMNCIDFTE